MGVAGAEDVVGSGLLASLVGPELVWSWPDVGASVGSDEATSAADPQPVRVTAASAAAIQRRALTRTSSDD